MVELINHQWGKIEGLGLGLEISQTLEAHHHQIRILISKQMERMDDY